MGESSVTCSASGLNIEGGTAVRCLLLTQSPYDDGWLLRAPPLRASYDSYGSIENIHPDDLPIVDLWLRGLREDLIERGVGDNSYHDLPTSRDMTFDALLAALRAGCVKVRQDAKTFWRERDTRDKCFTLSDQIRSALETATPGCVAMSPTPEKYVVDEPVPNLVRVRYGQHLHDDTLTRALERARTVVEQSGFVGAIVAGSGRYPDEVDLLVFSKRRTGGNSVGPQWDKAAGQAADDDKHLPVSMVMIREDVWQALIAYPHKSSVNPLCTTCGQESYYHEKGRVCPLKQIHTSPYKDHESGTTYTHGPVFPDGVEHKIEKNEYGESVWYGISAYRAGVKHAWAAISAHFAARAKRLDQDSSYFGNFILRHGIVEDAENLTGVTWIMLESTPGVIGISEHLSMLLADKTEPPTQLLDAIAELAAVCHVLRGVGVKLRPAGFGPQYAEWPEFVRYHRTLAHIASAKADAREQNDPCFSSLQAALLTLAYDPNDGI